MVELKYGTLVPAFLTNVSPKSTKRLCLCGVTNSEIPTSWTESFHNNLHKNIYKLRFTGDVHEVDLRTIKENDLSYFIFSINNNVKDEKLLTTLKNIKDYVNLEHGIVEKNVLISSRVTYLAVLPCLKVIGYLEVEPLKTATVKFSVHTIWVAISYKKKNVKTNLLNNLL
ncbi:uncharacterized protein LOC126901590 [Daktulosphaira vitifoliae]|uniref:uncharacterized protein LOC126901590 n=1 Tax=Daktulosphaira vitifoliae TaxID=58002 RepID=UPI0021AB006D|nr:uncharacterized protein LOC126901590 [Daktulosphaira vitifoliae]